MDTLSSSGSMVGSGDVVSTESLDSEDPSRSVVSTSPSITFSDILGAFEILSCTHGILNEYSIEGFVTKGFCVPGCLLAVNTLDRGYLLIGTVLSTYKNIFKIELNRGVSAEDWIKRGTWLYCVNTPEAQNYLDGKVSK